MTYGRVQRFTWDESKNASNRDKHGIAFEDVRELFTNGNDYLEIVDADHSGFEDRFIAIGPVRRGVVLVVWTERDEDVIRIISARLATQRERAKYLAHMERTR